MRIAVVANGDLPPAGEDVVRELLRSSDRIIAVDGGLRHVRQIGVWPHVIVGDLDSAPAALVDEAVAHGATVQQLSADKDETDLQHAIAVAQGAGATSMIVACPFGGRLDHELASITVLASDDLAGIDVFATDGRRQMWVVREAIDLALPLGETVSLIPWRGDVHGVLTEGLAWPLVAETLYVGQARGVSNVVDAPRQSVRIDNGVLLVISDADHSR